MFKPLRTFIGVSLLTVAIARVWPGPGRASAPPVGVGPSTAALRAA
jgi:hypothetical protein